MYIPRKPNASPYLNHRDAGDRLSVHASDEKPARIGDDESPRVRESGVPVLGGRPLRHQRHVRRARRADLECHGQTLPPGLGGSLHSYAAAEAETMLALGFRSSVPLMTQ